MAVALKLALTLTEFNAVKVAFLEALRKSIASRHPTAVCKLWKTTLRTEVIAVTTGRRRLLQANGYGIYRYVTKFWGPLAVLECRQHSRITTVHTSNIHFVCPPIFTCTFPIFAQVKQNTAFLSFECSS